MPFGRGSLAWLLVAIPLLLYGFREQFERTQLQATLKTAQSELEAKTIQLQHLRFERQLWNAERSMDLSCDIYSGPIDIGPRQTESRRSE